MKKKKLFSTHPAIIAVWAALIAVASLLPAFPLIGGTGGTFSLGNAILPLSGILFGPWAGAIAAGVGGFLGQLLAPSTVIFGPLQFVLSIISAMAAGFAMEKKWIWPLVAMVLLTVLFWIIPPGNEAPLLPVVYIPAYLGILLGWFVFRNWISSPNRAKLFVAVFCCMIAGTQVNQAGGNIWALFSFALPKALWYSVIPIAPVERILFALAGTIIGVPLLIGLPKISIPVGPELYVEEEDI